MTSVDLTRAPSWLTKDKLDDDVLVGFCWDREVDEIDDTPSSQEDVWRTHKLIAFSETGLYEFNQQGVCTRSKSIHKIDQGE